MPRCDYDVVFYRVFCVTLLAIAFTFTIILTNVFIDIDGLIAGKDKHSSNGRPKMEVIPEDITPEPYIGDDMSYGDGDDSYRTKRSIDTQNFLFHLKNPKKQNVLTNRLETLLEALDAEELPENAKTEKNIEKDESKELPKEDVTEADEIKIEEEKIKKQKEENMLHLTMHNVLLQGIIGHMDLNEVYKRVNSLMKNLSEDQKDQKDNEKSEENSSKKQLIESKPQDKSTLDDRLVAELIKCNDLQDQILSSAVKKVVKVTKSNIQRAKLIDHPEITTHAPEDLLDVESSSAKSTVQDVIQTNNDIAINTKLGPQFLLKTTVDIRSLDNDQNETISKNNIHGIMEVIFNGKSIKFSKPDEEEPLLRKTSAKYINQPEFLNAEVEKVVVKTTSKPSPVEEILAHKKIPKIYLKSFISKYFKQFLSKDLEEELNEGIETKRLKRHVKLKFNKENTGQMHLFHEEVKPPLKENEDDELYVEIETHFDSKGMKGEKKKKLIRSLIDKIQKAIHSEENQKVDNETSIKKVKHKPLHVKKRMQNPLEQRLGTTSKYVFPVDTIVHRQLNPIIFSQTSNTEDLNYGPTIKDRSGESWKKDYMGPTFLTSTKSINSAEMSELEVDYNRVLDLNGIPQRLQKPLNTDMSDETDKSNSYLDLGNMKFFIKDVDGSGFSIGFNQYVDEPPDPEAIKLFTGLENVIKTYHQNIDQAPELEPEINLDLHEKPNPDASKNNHIIVRRSVNHQHDYHSNEYKIIYDGNFLPFHDYKEIYERENSKPNSDYTQNQYRESPLIVDEHIFDKNLKPAEIFGLANLFRKKRSLRVKKISNLKSKIKLNRYLNTKAMATKRIFLNKKRHKRQISKIRIIASDLPYRRSGEPNIFVVSGENVFADRAIVKDVEGAEAEGEKLDDSEYAPYTPYQPEESESTYKEFESRSRNNNLMSKYPHIFMEEISKSKEEISPAHSLIFGKIPGFRRSALYNLDNENSNDEFMSDGASTQQPYVEVSTEPIDRIQGVHEILEALKSPKNNYKVTLKLTPKNLTNTHPGFKEVHTSINKVYNKNGIMYTSLVNVSEISNITHLNRSENKDSFKAADSYLAKQFKTQHDKMQLLLKQHQKLINDQLAKLNAEKSHIESILIDENNTVVPQLDYFNMMPAQSHKVLHMGRDDVRKMSDVLSNRKIDISIPDIMTESDSTTVITTTMATTTTTTAPTTVTTTETPTPTVKTTVATPPSFFTEKIQNSLLHTIERNEKLTDQILRKVDKNTEILQTFLNKLTSTISTQKSIIQTPAAIEEKTDLPFPKFDHNMHQFNIDWRQHGAMPFNPNMFRKNSSHIAIPFLYAYQHPIMPLKMNSPVASVVYHGTIHTNPLHAKEISAEKEKFQSTLTIPAKNQTRFFIDETEGDYKVIPVNNIEKPKMFTNITIT